jgi:hypothetical protein
LILLLPKLYIFWLSNISILSVPEKFSETEIINMLEFLIDNISVIFGGRVFQDSRHTYVSQEKRKEAIPIL